MIAEFDNIPVSLDAMLPQNKDLLDGDIMRACGITKGMLEGAHLDFKLLRKSVDARRKRDVHFVINVAVELPGLAESGLTGLRLRKGVVVRPCTSKAAPDIADCSVVASSEGFKRPVIVGAGPAGLMAALVLAQAKLRPIVLERGKPASERLLDVESFAMGGPLDPNSNVQFGEGGAGTFSDGKLTTNTKSPHISYVLEQLVEAGAPAEILTDSKPHIGTDMLPDVVTRLRQKAESLGAEFWFNAKLVGIECAEGLSHLADDDASPGHPEPPRITAVEVVDVRTGASSTLEADAVLLAIGHSARDTFEVIQGAGLDMERKPFAVGVRIEHLQSDIDKAQYGASAGHPALGPADYKLSVRVDDAQAEDGTRGVYTFCMCPGGTVVAASSEPGHLCVNGMSAYARDGRNSNSALLVEVRPSDLEGDDVLAGVALQRRMERFAFALGMGGKGSESDDGASYIAPVQTVGDFLAGRFGNPSLRVVPSYPRGVRWADLRECLPDFVSRSLERAIPRLGRKLEGFSDPQAVMTGVEPRSSSPIRIVRDGKTLQSTSVRGIFPVGEGCGYAGGIMSAATDGIRCALACIDSIIPRG